MTKRPLTALLLAVTALPLAACAGYVDGPGYAGGPYAYDGYYDGYYGDVYDGYWGDDGVFYYRHGANERGYTPKGKAAEEIAALAREVIKRLKLT